MKDISEKTCFLDLAPGLNGIKYNQSFVKAKSEAPYPCNYAAEEVKPDDVAMKISMGK